MEVPYFFLRFRQTACVNMRHIAEKPLKTNVIQIS